MGGMALLGIVVVALVLGIVVQLLTRSSHRYEWLAIAVAGAFGAYFASESFPGSNVFSGVTQWGPELDGLLLVPAVIGGIVLAIVADLGIRSTARQGSPA